MLLTKALMGNRLLEGENIESFGAYDVNGCQVIKER